MAGQGAGLRCSPRRGVGRSSGPMGSGKTTTLYALLCLLQDREANVVTLEDPPEYAIDGINKVAVSPEHGLDFAAGVRSLLRLDPDYLMLGEIRDPATVKTSCVCAGCGIAAVTDGFRMRPAWCWRRARRPSPSCGTRSGHAGPCRKPRRRRPWRAQHRARYAARPGGSAAGSWLSDRGRCGDCSWA